MSLLTFKIVTPVKKILEEKDINSVSIPTENGEITILPGHIPLVSKVVSGEIVIRKNSNEYFLMTADGFLKLDKQGNILVLSDYAVRSEDIEIAKVEEAKKRALDIMREKKSKQDFVIAEAELRKTLIELKTARHSKSKSPKS